MKEPQKPAPLTGFLWSIFSATGTLAAFLLPAHLVSIGTFRELPDGTWFKIYFAILLLATFYHGMYRLKTVLHDLKIL